MKPFLCKISAILTELQSFVGISSLSAIGKDVDISTSIDE